MEKLAVEILHDLPLPPGSTPGWATHRLITYTPLKRIRPEIQRQRDKIPAPLVAKIKACVEGAAPWPMFIYGPAGTGKSCAALYLADRMKAGTAMYYDFSDLWRDARDAEFERLYRHGQYGDRLIDIRTFWEEWEGAELCILDELGTRGTASDFQYDTLKLAVDLRVNRVRPLVAISNLDLEGIAKVFDDRIASRLAGGTIIKVDGPDRRVRRDSRGGA